MGDVEAIEDLLDARQVLKTGLEKSREIASAITKVGSRLNAIDRRLPSLEAEVLMRKCNYFSISDQINNAIRPAAAVLNIFNAVRELQNSISVLPCSNLTDYLSVMRQLEEALRFLSDNCRLAIQWMEDVVRFFGEDGVTSERCLFSGKKSLRVLKEILEFEKRAHLEGGLLSVAFNNVEAEFRRLLIENSAPLSLESASSSKDEKAFNFIAASPLTESVVGELKAIIDRLHANNRAEKCVSMYTEIRSLNVRQSLQAFDLDYSEMSETDIYLKKWREHLEFAVKHLFAAESKLCNDVFEKIGSNVRMECFANIALQSGFLSFLQFGNCITQSKKDPVKLLNLLDMFQVLNNLRTDINRLFGGEACSEIQSLTRDLVKRVVNGTCEIFWELPVQVELQRRSSPPADGGVPGLVSFVTDYCNQLLGDQYRPILTQVLVIHQSWKQEERQEDLLQKQIYIIIRELALNLDAWSKAYENLSQSYYFMMNNHCHFSNLKGTELGDMMGDSWIQANQQYKDYYAALYLRESWGRLLNLLNQKGNETDADLLKKRLKEFNEAFHQTFKKQSKWVISHERLREEMCMLLVEAIIPVYRNYMKNYLSLFEQDSSARKYVKYTTQNMEDMLSSLFQRKLIKYENTTNSHFIGKIKNVVTNQLRMTLTAV